jgi:hypothetical protein
MSFMDRLGKKQYGADEKVGLGGSAGRESQDMATQDTALLDTATQEALANFRLSVMAWSEAELAHARTPVRTVRQRSWRLAAGWALAGVLAAGGLGGGIQEHRHKLEAAKIVAAAREAEQRRVIAEQRAKEEEDLLANVDSDVSREVPSAMEPLAQMMDDETK